MISLAFVIWIAVSISVEIEQLQEIQERVGVTSFKVRSFRPEILVSHLRVIGIAYTSLE